jgi:hypothetical protein
MSEPLLMVHTYKLADESAYRSRLTAWFDYIAGNHPHVLHHKVYVDEATGGIVNLQVHPGPEPMEKMLQLFMARIDEWAGLIGPDGNHVHVCGEPPQELEDNVAWRGSRRLERVPAARWLHTTPAPVSDDCQPGEHLPGTR